MKTTINIITGLYDAKDFILTDDDNTLEIDLKGTTYKNVDYFAKINYNGAIETHKFVDNKVSIDLKGYGIIQLLVVAKNGTDTLREFKCENLTIKELDNTIQAIPQVEELKAEIKAFESEISSELLKVETLCNKTHELVIKLNELKEIVK